MRMFDFMKDFWPWSAQKAEPERPKPITRLLTDIVGECAACHTPVTRRHQDSEDEELMHYACRTKLFESRIYEARLQQVADVTEALRDGDIDLHAARAQLAELEHEFRTAPIDDIKRQRALNAIKKARHLLAA